MVSKIIEAIYENGVLQPLEPLSLAEHETVRLGILEGNGPETPHPYIACIAGVCAGRLIIRGTRIPVDLILRVLGQGLTTEELLEDYPHLSKEDIQAALLYGSEMISNEEVLPLAMGGK